MKKYLYSFIFFIPFIVLTSCNKEPGHKPPTAEVSRTLFVYMAADNSLGYSQYDNSNIQAMISGATASNMNGGKIVVYHDSYSNPPQLLEISAGTNGKGDMKVLKDYHEQDSSDPSVFISAVDDMMRYAPADEYGLVVWSHATGWMPAAMHPVYGQMSRSSRAGETGAEIDPQVLKYIRDPFALETRAAIQDGSSWMELSPLVNAIPAGVFDFIIFDCCLMGSAEVAYALRNKTSQVVVSPAEVLGNGMPYDLIIPHIFASSPRLGANGVAQAYYEHYAAKSGQLQSATTAVYDCSKMDAMAAVMARVISANTDRIGSLDVSTMQCYDRHTRNTMFDIGDFVESLVSRNESLYNEFRNALDAVVTYKATTGLMINLTIDPQHYTGMSIYVPLDRYQDLNEYYRQTAWYNAIGYPKTESSRTVFVYLAADNSLGNNRYDIQNLTNLLLGATRDKIGNGKIIAFHDGYQSLPRLVEISADAGEAGREIVLKTYDELNSADISVYRAALDDMVEFAPADSYGIIFWSHGTGWMPASLHNEYARMSGLFGLAEAGVERYIRDPFKPISRAFGQDGSDWMEISAIADATPDGMFDFMIFDACLMGGVETAYAMRNKTKYMVASTAEVLGEGLPYLLITEGLFKEDPLDAAIEVSRTYYDYYNGKSGQLQSATTTVFDCSELEELASVMTEVVSSFGGDIPDMNVSGIQYYDRHTLHTMFDLRDYVDKLLDGEESELLNRLDAALEKLIPYKATTGLMINLFIDPARYSGISAYIPMRAYADLNAFYEHTDWYRRVFE